MNPEIFRAYDVRGLVARDLTPPVVRQLGQAIATLARERGGQTLAVGRDCRLSSPTLRDALVAGLRAGGVDVIDVGLVPTPLLYFAVHHWGLDGGVMITGSHNPPEYNGFKILIGREAIHGEAIQTLARLIQTRQLSEGEGALEARDVSAVYIDWVSARIDMGPRRLKVVVDGGNGMGGPTAQALYERLGVDVVPLYIEPDGAFPNHHPDPTVEANLVDLRAAVLEHDADLGVGYDGDGDRIGVLDERGQVLWGDRLMIILARGLLEVEPGARIVGEVKCSQTLYDEIRRHGGVADMWKTGHSLIKARMKETGAALAGEMSGHIFYAHRYFGFDDAVYTGARLLELLSQTDAPLSAQLADVPETFVTPELRVDCPEGLKFQVAERLAALLSGGLDSEQDASAAVGAPVEVITIDGMRARFDDGAWALVRASNTQPVLVLRVEAPTPARRDALEAWLRDLVARTRLALEAPAP